MEKQLHHGIHSQGRRRTLTPVLQLCLQVMFTLQMPLHVVHRHSLEAGLALRGNLFQMQTNRKTEYE